MAIRKHAWRIEAAQQGTRLDHFLAEVLSRALGRAIARNEVLRLIGAGAVCCNGRSERSATMTLNAGTQIEVIIDPAKLDGAGPSGIRPPLAKSFVWTPERILFEDEWLIVADKPAGLPTQPTLDPARASAFGTLQEFLRQRDGGAPYVGLHHRLDRDTSGVLLFTKDQKANAGVSALFAGKTVQKTYVALAVAGPAEADAWEVRNHLGVVGRTGKASRFGAVRSGGDSAHTSFSVPERFPGAVLIEARPHTGRTHQIRVHLAEGGHPIFGDTFYGGPAEWKPASGAPVRFPRVMLHAAALEFAHPITKAPLTIRSPLPMDFAACLRQLRSGS